VPEIIWADTSLLRALDILADRLPVQITVSSGFSLSRSLPFACGEGLTLHLSPQLPNPSVLLHTALSCGFTAICPPWRWGSTIDLYCNHHSWLLRPGQYCCQICFLQHALRSLGVPLSISGFLDGPLDFGIEIN